MLLKVYHKPVASVSKADLGGTAILPGEGGDREALKIERENIWVKSCD